MFARQHPQSPVYQSKQRRTPCNAQLYLVGAVMRYLLWLLSKAVRGVEEPTPKKSVAAAASPVSCSKVAATAETVHVTQPLVPCGGESSSNSRITFTTVSRYALPRQTHRMELDFQTGGRKRTKWANLVNSRINHDNMRAERSIRCCFQESKTAGVPLTFDRSYADLPRIIPIRCATCTERTQRF